MNKVNKQNNGKITKFIDQPVTPFHINQNFGDNKACIPVSGKGKLITCDGHNPPKGYRSVYSFMNGHNGLDLRAGHGQPVYCPQDGIVEELVTDETRGYGISIITSRKFYCIETKKQEYFKMRFWHNMFHFKKLGDKVFMGDLIALADNTGYSSGNHLHFEIKPITHKVTKDSKIKNVVNILQGNGYLGAVDPLPYMTDKPAKRWLNIKSYADRLKFIISLIIK